MSKVGGYRVCFVPLCLNSSIKTPEKKFLHVPNDINRRNKWFQAVRRLNNKSKSSFYCCEDHFDVSKLFNDIIIGTLIHNFYVNILI